MFKRSLTVFALALAALPMAASATIKVYSFNLDAMQEVPTNSSTAAGSFQLTVDDVADTLSFVMTAFNLQGTVQGAHIHMAPMGSNGSVQFNLFNNADASGPVTVGPFLVPNSYALLGNNKAAGSTTTLMPLADAINAMPWNFYVNLHTSVYGGGEIRGQLAPIPEPGTYALLAIGLGVIGVAARRRRVV